MTHYGFPTPRLASRGPHMRPTDSPLLAQALAPFPLVGRASEMGALHSLLDDAEKGRGRTVFLSGEPGIGKTRLSEELAREASRRNWVVAVGRAYAVESGVPYAPFADALLPIL